MATQDSFSDLLQCPVCLERFTQPKMLPCQHTFCRSCLRGIVKDAKTVDCPTCRSPHQVPEQGVSAFPDNLVVKSLLEMPIVIDESAACNDCGNKQILSACEHCQEQVCPDCRAAHNRLVGEISVLLQCLPGLAGMENPNDDMIQAAHASLKKTEQVQADIRTAFDEAIEVLKERKEEMMQRVRIVSNIQRAVIKGTSDVVIVEIRKELASFVSRDGLKRMKESLMSVGEMLSGELEFIHDVSDVSIFGELRCGGEPVLIKIQSDSCAGPEGNVIPRMEFEPAADRDVFGPVTATALGLPVDGDTQRRLFPPVVGRRFQTQHNRLPIHVDYQTKNSAWKRIISQPPPVNDDEFEFWPTETVFSQQQNAIYCLANGQLLKFDIESGHGTAIFDTNAVHLAMTDYGSLFLLGLSDHTLTKIPASALASQHIDKANAIQTMILNSGRTPQICYHRDEFAILDSGRNSLLKLKEHGKVFGEIKLDISVSDSSRMCVDRKGRIYVSGVCITDRNIYDVNSCDDCGCYVSNSVEVRWEVIISILTWDGEEIEQLVLDEGSEEYQYRFIAQQQLSNSSRCPMGRSHDQIDYNSVPSDDQVVRDQNSIRGLCVDGDGYMSVIRRDESHIDIYDPKHNCYCTIGKEWKRGYWRERGGLTLTPDGRFIVCDTYNKKIDIIY